MNILVTGGTVFVSRYTAEYFASIGHNVYVLNRGNRTQSEKVTPIIADRHFLGNTLKQYVFDAVIDVTAYNDKDTDDLLDGLGKFGKYILISSSAVYPETLPQPFSELSPVGENSIWGKYGTDKIAAEKALLKRVPEAYIIRPPYLCGPMNNVYREAFVFECAEKDRPFYIPANGEMKLQFFHIGDLCRFIEIIINTAPSEHIYNVGYNETISVKEWVTMCYSIVGKDPMFISVEDSIPQRSYFPFYDYEYKLSVERMYSLFSNLTPLNTSMEQAYKWYKNNRELVTRKPLINFIDENLS